MQLTFLYIKDYGKLKNVGFNFSSQFRYQYFESEKKLIVEKNNDFSFRFYKNLDATITSLSAIIGENGVGKSTLLNFIKNNLINAGGGIHSPCIIGIYNPEDKEHQLHCYEIEIPELESSEKTNLLPVKNKKRGDEGFSIYPKLDIFNRITFINYSNYLDLTLNESEHDGYFNISTNRLAQYSTENIRITDRNLKINEVELFRLEEVKRQLRFYKEYKDFLPFKRPEHILIGINKTNGIRLYNRLNRDHKDVMKNLDKDDTDSKEKNHLKTIENTFENLNKVKNLITKDKYHSFREKCYIEMIYSLAIYYTYSDGALKDFNSYLTHFLNELKETTSEENDTYTLTKKLLNILITGESSEIAIYQLDYKKVLELIEKIISTNDEFDNYGDSLSIRLTNDNEKNVLELLDAQTNVTNSDIINFFWPLSSGENSLFSLYSRFYDVIYKEKLFSNIDLNENILILLDEPEIGLHPEWQRTFLDDFLKVISRIFKYKKIQILFTSHSPFLISDLVLSQINFMEFDLKSNRTIVADNPLIDKKSTFGGNIHTLLQDSFFMKNGFSGAIVLKEMDSFIDFLLKKSVEEIRYDYEYVDWFIHQIGEPIIQNKLIQILESRLSIDLLNSSQRIKTLEEKVQAIEGKTIKDDPDKTQS